MPHRKVLACVVYAKRPLLLDELCEAVQIIGTPEGEDMRTEDCIRQTKLLRSCEFLLKFDDIKTSPGVTKKMCTLWHASFRTFLVNKSDVLGGSIACQDLAMGCLKYLRQPKYDGLLSKVVQSFSTISDEDIVNHHLLVYSAKYWRSHMDTMSYSLELCQKLEDFVRSTNFMTCLQVQSLLVGGQSIVKPLVSISNTKSFCRLVLVLVSFGRKRARPAACARISSLVH